MAIITDPILENRRPVDEPVAGRSVDPDTLDNDGFFALDRARSLLVMAAVLTLGSVLLPTSVRWLTLPLAFALPGHAMVCAIFGRHLEFGGVRRAALSIALTLTSYPIIALSALVFEMRMTKTVIVVGTDMLVGGCATVVARRAWLRQRGLAEAEPVSDHYADATIRIRELIIPGTAMVTAILVVLASVVVLPRRPPDEYSSIALDGTWALASRVVPVDPGRSIEVQFEVANRTREVHDYTVSGQVVDGPSWSAVTKRLRPQEVWKGTVSGPVKAGSCRSRLNIQLSVTGESVRHSPLAIFLSDRSVEC